MTARCRWGATACIWLLPPAVVVVAAAAAAAAEPPVGGAVATDGGEPAAAAAVASVAVASVAMRGEVAGMKGEAWGEGGNGAVPATPRGRRQTWLRGAAERAPRRDARTPAAERTNAADAMAFTAGAAPAGSGGVERAEGKAKRGAKGGEG